MNHRMKLTKILGLVAVMAAFTLGTALSASSDIYPDPSLARPQLAAALKTAAATHKRVIVDFGGNWCGDCHVLDIYFHNPRNLPILESNFILVHVNVGHYDANLDLAERYGIPLQKGVPALVVLSDTGKVLLSQKSGEFEKMGHMEPSSVTSFLVQWKPTKPGCSVMAVTC
jgi:thioredoxin 1